MRGHKTTSPATAMNFRRVKGLLAAESETQRKRKASRNGF
jgi:hypothetical protein